MKRISTQSMATVNATREGKRSLSPSKSTIDFIKQFARSYNHSTKLHPSFSGFVAN